LNESKIYDCIEIQNHHGIWTTHIYYARVLHKADLYWISTDEEVAIKTVSWRCIRACQNRLSEDFVKEISALQYLSQWRAAEGKSITDVVRIRVVKKPLIYLNSN
jgi:hypothetical protein